MKSRSAQMRNLWICIVLTFSTAAMAQQPADLLGTWQARMVVDEKELGKQGKEYQKLIRDQVAKFQKKPWTLTLEKDGKYRLPLAHGQDEEGIWASKELRLHLRVKKHSGKKASVERVDKFDVAPDRKSFRTKLTPYLSLEYVRRT